MTCAHTEGMKEIFSKRNPVTDLRTSIFETSTGTLVAAVYNRTSVYPLACADLNADGSTTVRAGFAVPLGTCPHVMTAIHAVAY